MNTPTAPPDAPPARKRRWLRRLGLTVGVLAILLVVLVALLPTLLSTGPGNRVLLGLVNGAIPGTVSAERLSVGWFAGPSVRDLRLDDPEGQPVITLASADAPDATLVRLIGGGRALGKIDLADGHADIIEQADGRTNLDAALSKPSERRPRDQPPREKRRDDEPIRVGWRTADVNARNLSLTYTADDLPPISGSVPELRLVANDDREVMAQGRGSVTLDEDAGAFSLDLTVRNAVADDGTLQIDQAGVNGTANFDKLPIAAIDRIVGLDGLLVDALGDPTDPQNHLSLDLKADLAAGATGGNATLIAKAPRLEANVVGRPNDQGIITGDGSTIDYRLTPAFVKRMAERSELDLAIDGVKQVRLAFDTLRLPADGRLGNATVGLTLTADDLALAGDPMWDGLTIAGLTVTAPTMTLAEPEPITLNARLGDTASQADPIAVTADALLATPEAGGLPTGLARLTASLREVPMAFIERYTGEQPLLAALLDRPAVESLAVTIDGDPTASPLPLTLDLDADNLEVDAAAEFGERGITLREGTTLELTLTPQRFDALMRELNRPAPDAEPDRANRDEPAADAPQVRLGQPVTVTAKVTSGRVPLPFNLADLAIRVDARAPSLVLTQPDAPTERLRDVVLRFETQRLADSFRLRLDGNRVSETSPTARPAQTPPADGAASPPRQAVDIEPLPDAGIKSDTVVRKLIGADGKVDIDAMSLTTDSQITALPIGLIDRLTQNDVLLEPILGGLANVSLKGDFPGDLKLKADSPTASVLADARIDNQRRLLLNKDLVATLFVTPEMSEQFLGKVHPMFKDARSSEQPVKLTIDKDMRRIPLTGFKTEDLRLSGTLDGGIINMNRAGWLNGSLTDASASMLSLLSLGAIRAEPDRDLKTYPARFTPMAFTISNNVVDSSQVWVVSDDLAIGFVGKVSLDNLEDPEIIDMRMGMTTASLIVERPELSVVLQPDQVAELPLEGTVTQPKPDYGILTGDILGAGFAGVIGSATGGLFGDVAGEFASAFRKNAKHDWQLPDPAQALVEKASTLSLGNDDADLNEQQLEQRNQRRDRVNEMTDKEKRQQRREDRRQQPDSPAREEGSPAERVLRDLLGQ
jgi:hypothetical protein